MSYKNIAAKAEGNHMKQEKKQPGRLKMLAGYYKPYNGLFFAGSNADRVDRIMSVQELINEIMTDYRLNKSDI